METNSDVAIVAPLCTVSFRRPLIAQELNTADFSLQGETADSTSNCIHPVLTTVRGEGEYSPCRVGKSATFSAHSGR